MKEIKIKCINKYKYQIIIYDCYGNKVFDGFTDETGTLILDVPYYGVYKILILRNKNIKVITNFYVDENQYNFFYFRVVSIKRYLHLVTFKITDEYYKGLPIKEGKITLWQKST